eukprot:GFUD01039082.1.p1 GENE.GFUD01039082.1~~GFUD01039082.1.p1  ORF type:complete len:248 (+),score=49.66 GFUD01039082.1:47-745(+)
MENIFEKQGIQFKIITNEMIPSVVDFMWENFFPDEPINRSLGGTRNWVVDDFYLIDTMKDGTSMVALDKDGNIIGARLGIRQMRSKWVKWIFDRMIVYLPQWSLFWMPSEVQSQMPIMIKLFTLLGYNVWKMFDELGCDMIYEDKAVCSARSAGVRGLGTELCKRTENLAKEMGCTHTYACVTGKYSRKIFEKLGHTILSEVVYADFKDENGELYLKDTREHLSVISCVKEL